MEFNESSSLGDSRSVDVDLGDLDGDGDLDIVFANSGVFDSTCQCLIEQKNKIWRNIFETSPAPLISFVEAANIDESESQSTALGDLDNDGDLDIYFANHGPDTIWENSGNFNFRLVARLGDLVSKDVSLGDLDGDGDLDAVSVSFGDQPNIVWRNDGAFLFVEAASLEGGNSHAVALGDLDHDLDLDIYVGNEGADVVWINDGELNFIKKDSFGNAAGRGVAIGDLDMDSDLDIVVANTGTYGRANDVYFGTLYGNSGIQMAIEQPIPTHRGSHHSTPFVLRSPSVSFSFDFSNSRSESMRILNGMYSTNGGGIWLPATISNLKSDSLIWDANKDLIKGDDVVFRVAATHNINNSVPERWGRFATQTATFRVEASPLFVKTVYESGQPASGVVAYIDGEALLSREGVRATTDSTGLMALPDDANDTSVVALRQVNERASNRIGHEGWSARTFISNLSLDNDGELQTVVIGTAGEQRLVLSKENPLVHFNIVVSVEWDADASYISMLEDALRKASDYLYDVSDGQMAFGQVAIYDNAKYWGDADFQISAKNTVRPYAYIGGIDSDDTSHAIRVGRFWNGSAGNEGNWNEPNGYRTLIHEFGHYSLYLHDEYFVRTTDAEGRFTGRQSAACTGLSVVSDDENAANGSIMYYQYKASELVDKDRWNANCQNSEQHRINGKSDWETVLEYYGGEGWTLNTPSSRGSVMEGPEKFPRHLLPFPSLVISNTGVADSVPITVTVKGPTDQPIANALVALFTTPDEQTVAIDQGLTDTSGHIMVYGANKDDSIQAASFDGSLAGVAIVGDESEMAIALESVSVHAAAENGSQPISYLGVTPSSDGTGLVIKMYDLPQSSLPLNALLSPSEGGGSPQSTILAFSAETNAYGGAVSLEGVGLGTGKIQVSGGNLAVPLISDYNLQRVTYNVPNSLYSEDGNIAIHMPPNALSGGADGYATILPTGYVPGPLPAGMQVFGQAYEVRLSSANILTKDALIELSYHPNIVGGVSNLEINFWDLENKAWRPIASSQDSIGHLVSAATNRMGIYALMGKKVDDYRTYFPLVLK